jgi:hypothetical protein
MASSHNLCRSRLSNAALTCRSSSRCLPTWTAKPLPVAVCERSRPYVILVAQRAMFALKLLNGLRPPAECKPSAVGFMSDDPKDGLPQILLRGLSRLRSAVGRSVHAAWRVVRRTSTDPVLPLILLGVVAVAFGFAFILDAPPMVVFGVLIIGGLTAFIETKMHDENGGR